MERTISKISVGGRIIACFFLFTLVLMVVMGSAGSVEDGRNLLSNLTFRFSHQ